MEYLEAINESTVQLGFAVTIAFLFLLALAYLVRRVLDRSDKREAELTTEIKETNRKLVQVAEGTSKSLDRLAGAQEEANKLQAENNRIQNVKDENIIRFIEFIQDSIKGK